MTDKIKKVGILGGTFNPIHLSHLLLARQAYETLGLDYVMVMPVKKPQFKDPGALCSDEDRVAMIKLAIEDIPYLQFSDFELVREGKTYTSDTVRMLNESYPDTRFYFIMGGDSLDYFENWHEPDVILENCALVCTGRADYDYKKSTAGIRHLVEMFGRYESEGKVPEIINLKTPLMNISSSEIRDRVACNMSIEGLVSEKVAEYIRRTGVFKLDRLESIKAELHEILGEKRYTHTIGVAETAAFIAAGNDFDVVKAYTAGLLHDCAKKLDDEFMISEAIRFGYKPSAQEKKYPNNLLHSKVGAFYAKEKYGIEDDDTFNAIFYHTSARLNMSVLEKIIYISDTVEPNRTMQYIPSLEVIRATATADLDLACLMIMDNNVKYLLETYGDSVCPETLAAYEYMKEKRGNGNV